MFDKPVIIGVSAHYLSMVIAEHDGSFFLNQDLTISRFVNNVEIIVGRMHPLEIPGLDIKTYLSTGNILIKYYSNVSRTAYTVELTDEGFNNA